MNFHLFLQRAILLGMVFIVFKSYAQSDSESKPLNVILLMADDLGYGDVGFTGNKDVLTPNLDQMSNNGITLSHFYAAAPLCSPTRASVLTGRNPFRQGIFAAHTGGMRPAEKTIPEMLKKQGYATGFFGKWHLGWVEPDIVESRGMYSPPWHHGYDETFATKSAVPTWDPTKTPENWKSWGAKKDGSWGGSRYIQNGVPVTKNLGGDDSRVIMDRAIPFIEKSIIENKPFFTTIWFHAPHEPVVAGPKYLAKYPNLPERKKHLYGCITAMDEQIGRLQQFLKSKKIDKNTIVFFCSDNGPADPLAKKGIASAGPFRGHKHQMWEGGLRVPSLISWPGHIKKGIVSKQQSSTNDYFPTILDLLDIKLSKKIPLDGISLRPLIDGETKIKSNPIAFGYQRLYKKTELYAFVKGKYKICIPEVGKEMMLFNLEKDPGETKNIASKKTELLEEMMLQLDAEKESWKLSREGKDYQW